MNPGLSVGIVGGGIGGLTLGLSLLRYNHSVKVFERSKKICDALGAGFGMTTGSGILHKNLGINVKPLSPPIKFLQVSLSGKILRKRPVHELFPPEIRDHASWVIRDELLGVLESKFPKGVIHTDHNFLSFADSGNGVTAKFNTNNKEVEHNFDILIGCDGTRSSVRRKLFGDFQPVYSGGGMWWGVTEVPFDNDDCVHFDYGTNSQVGYFKSSADGKRAVIFRAHKSPTPPEADTWGRAGNREELMDILNAHSNPKLVELFRDANSLSHFGLYYHEPLIDTWHKGNVVLLGDACHATLPSFGQGANMAIDDAVTLSNFLENSLKSHGISKNGIQEAFTNFHKERQPKTGAMVKLSKSRHEIEVSSGWKAKLRDLEFKLMMGPLFPVMKRLFQMQTKKVVSSPLV